MQGAYSEIYLDEAMRNMGEMIEYGEDACGLDQDLLLRIFIRRGIPGSSAVCPGLNSAAA